MKKNKNNQLKRNLLICGDNMKALDDLIKQGIKVDLIYLDPPFFSNRHYEVVWGDEAEIRSFKDRWAGGISVYVEWMRDRVIKMYDVLKDTGSFYLHCDSSASHYLKIMLDEIFGQQNFKTEIIWKRSSAHSDTKQGRMQHGRIHDTIFFYTKSDSWTWNPIYTEYDDRYISQNYRHIEEKTGRLYRADNLTAAKPGGDTLYEWRVKRRINENEWHADYSNDFKNPKKGWIYKGIPPYKGRYWAYSHDKMLKFAREVRIHYSKSGMPNYKRYLDEMPGVPLQDIWVDIPPIGSNAAERLGYPTQKPEALMERIIKASSNKGYIVLDPFCGCGTAMAVSQRLGRRWLGIDISPTAVSLIQERIQKLGAMKGKDYEVIGMPTTETHLRELEPFEFQNWVINEMKARHSKKQTSDMGIDGYYEKTIFTDRAGIQVKQSEKVGRNVVDNFETALRRQAYEKGYIVAFSFTRGAHEEVARVKQKDLIIKLVKVEDLLYGKFKV